MPHSEHLLVLGTGNPKKGRELAALLAPHHFRVLTLGELENPLEVEETGNTFVANARLKAVEQARHLRAWVLADDSGIEVDALEGRPGVYSARYAGPQCDDEANNRKLLAELGDLPAPQRGAQYACAIVVADPRGKIRGEAFGICRGVIRREPSGSGGFGYDPLFELPQYGQTFGELSAEVKQSVSHRAVAMQQILPQLIHLALTEAW
jgi:XTP/dITP diphosphohydrolase